MRTIGLFSILILSFAACLPSAGAAETPEAFEPDETTVLLLHFDGAIENAAAPETPASQNADTPAFADGVIGQALSIRDWKDVVVLEDTEDGALSCYGGSPLTIEFRIRPPKIHPKVSRNLVQKGTGAGYLVSITGLHTLHFVYYSTGRWRSFSFDIDLREGEWSHLTVVLD